MVGDLIMSLYGDASESPSRELCANRKRSGRFSGNKNKLRDHVASTARCVSICNKAVFALIIPCQLLSEMTSFTSWQSRQEVWLDHPGSRRTSSRADSRSRQRSSGEDREARVLNQIIRVTPEGREYELDRDTRIS